MGRLLLIVAGTIITVALLIFFLLLYRYAVQDIGGDGIQVVDDTSKSGVISKPQVPTQWIEELAKRKRPNFSYPVREIQIELSAIKQSKFLKKHRLVLKNMDDYKLFCIKQIFNSKNLSFALYAKKKQTVVVMHDVSLAKLKKIAKYVKSYGIDMSIENYEKKD